MNAVAEECKVKKHHPEWSNIYNTTFIRWTTHSPPGLSGKDIEMAQFCDEQAVIFGEVVPESHEAKAEEGEGQDAGRDLADRVAVEGGDCCVPKPKAKA
jgi:4a-hydroxytetrahydrobiopterin dehydratase